MFKGSLKHHIKQALPAYAIMIILIMIASGMSENFRSVRNMSNVMLQATPLAIVAIGQAIVLIAAGIDMSVGSIISLSTVIMATVSTTVGAAAAAILALIAGAIVGIVNGIGVTKLHIPPLITTISTAAIVKGIALFILKSPGGSVDESILLLVKKVGPLLIPVASILMLLLYVAAFLFMHQTRTGRAIYALGGNEVNAKQTGFLIDRLTIFSYVLCGLLAAFSGVVIAGRIYSGDPLIGDNYSMDSVAAAIVGGISMSGGMGSVVGALAGAIILSMINNVLNMLNVFAYYQYIVKGLILLLALLVFNLRRAKRR